MLEPVSRGRAAGRPILRRVVSTEGLRPWQTPYWLIVANLHDQPRIGGLGSELVRRAQSGDRDAFEALATAAYDRLYSIGRRILRDAPAAEDAVQETLIRCWRDLRSLRDPERFEAWLHRLLVNACYDQARSRRRLEVAVSDIDADRSDPADDYAAVAQRDELERLFRQLPVEHRAAIVLTHYVGLSAPEAAQVLGVPPGTVYSRVHYGLRTMRGAAAPTSSLAPATVTTEKRR